MQPEQVINIAGAADKISWKPKMMGSDGLLTAIILQYRQELGLVEGIFATDLYSNVQPKTEYEKSCKDVQETPF